MRIGRIEIPNVFFVHVACGVVVLSAGALMVRHAFMGETVPVCSSRLNNGALFAIETRPGQLLSVEDLQASLAGQDRGVTENLQVVRFDNGPSKAGLRVRLAAIDGPISESGRPTIVSGIEFGWLPRRMPDRNVGCLGYNLKLPSGFKFGPGGALPSFVSSDAAGGKPAFTTKLTWRSDGHLILELIGQGGEKEPLHLEFASSQPLPLGRWTRIEQEVILNAPDKEDAELRVWIDDQIVIWHSNFQLRSSKEARLAGISVKLGYADGNQPAKTEAGKDAEIEISPFEIRWP